MNITDWLTPREIVFAVFVFVPFVLVMGVGCLYVLAMFMEHIIEDL
jgi:hypothetical protein